MTALGNSVVKVCMQSHFLTLCCILANCRYVLVTLYSVVVIDWVIIIYYARGIKIIIIIK